MSDDIERERFNARATLLGLVDELNDLFISPPKHQSAIYLLKRMLADEYLRDGDATDQATLDAIDASIGLDGDDRAQVVATWRGKSAAWVAVAVGALDQARRACLARIAAAETIEAVWQAVWDADAAMRAAAAMAMNGSGE